MISKAITILALVVPLFALSAQLALTSYDPLLFNLTFSEPVKLPAFQLLYNSIYKIPYDIKTNESVSDHFELEGNITGIDSDSSLQTYILLFNNPLSVGNGQLDLNCYSIKASKTEVRLDFPYILGIFLVIGVYFFNMFTEIGKLLM